MNEINIDDIETQLKTRTVTVVFTKLDGTERTMICTRDFSAIPIEKYPQQSEFPEVVYDHLVKVYDLEKQEWRSFRKSSVVSWS